MSPLLLLVCLGADPALAEEPVAERAWGSAAPSSAPTEEVAVPIEVAAPLASRREAPDYDGRPPAPVSAGEVARAVPRVVLAPLYVIERYVIYPPVAAFSMWAEKNRVPVRVFRALSVGGTEQHVTFLPTALIDFGLRPSIGVRVRGRHIGKLHDFDAQFAWGGRGWWLAQYEGRFAFAPNAAEPSEGSQALLHLRYMRRPDRIFEGIAPDSAERTRFLRTQIGGGVGADIVLGSLDRLRVEGLAQDDRFDPDGRYRDDPDVDDEYDTEDIPGFDSGFTLVGGLVTLELDSRAPRPQNGSGARISTSVLAGHDVTEGLGTHIRIDANGALFVDVSGHNHTFALRQYVGWASAPGGGTLPFTLMPTLGGNEYHRAFLEGSLRGPTALVTTLAYTWPTWVFTDGILFADVGGAFGPDFEGLSIPAMRVSGGFGMRIWQRRDASFNLLVAVGSTPFEDPFAVDAVRFTFGAERGF